MVKNMNELGHVEQELAELRSQMEKSFETVDGLARIQEQFEGLAQTYGELKEYIDRAQAILENATGIEERFEQRFQELETSLNARWEQTHAQLSDIPTDIRQDLEERVGQNIGDLKRELDAKKQELDEKMASILQESSIQGEAIQAPMKEFEVVVDQLENRTHIARLALRNMEQQVRTLRWATIGLAIFTVLAIAGLFWFATSQGSSGESKPAQTQTE